MRALDPSTAHWRKSSHSSSTANCVEIGRWRKSSHSGSVNCVEVGLAHEAVGVRDSKNPDGAVLVFPEATWRAFMVS